MATINVLAYSVTNNIVTLVTDGSHGLLPGKYFSVRNVNSSVNGEYFVISTPEPNLVTYSVAGVANITVTPVSGIIISTEINASGKPAYIYDQSADTWYQISGKVNTNGNYTWTGTHLHQAPVTMEDILIMSNVSASVSASPVGGGYLYVQDGELKFKGGNGTITTIASA